jgi:hypothetical protein
MKNMHQSCDTRCSIRRILTDTRFRNGAVLPFQLGQARLGAQTESVAPLKGMQSRWLAR